MVETIDPVQVYRALLSFFVYLNAMGLKLMTWWPFAALKAKVCGPNLHEKV